MMIHRKFRRFVPLLAAAALLAACVNDESAKEIAGPNLTEGLLDRYVALGNSITAGYQSAGINANTQQQAYPVLLARQANVVFNVPALALPGCPPPLAAPFSAQRIVPGATGTTCALRANAAPLPVQNFAVPGAKIVDAFNNLIPQSSANALTTFILGGRTQVRAMVEARPTFVSAWLGNNDALGSALAGQPALLTARETFGGSVSVLADSIRFALAQSGGPTGAALIGVVNPTLVPALQPGAYFYLAATATGGRFGGPAGKPVNPNCAPGTPGGSNLISILILSNAGFPEINCSDEAYPVGDPRRGTYVLTPGEVATISARVTDFNALLAEAASANNWVYLDPNEILLPFLADPSALRKCQGFATLPTPPTTADFVAAVQNTCPSADPAVGFGSLITFDGVHPSAVAHQLIANALATAINERYGTRITTG